MTQKPFQHQSILQADVILYRSVATCIYSRIQNKENYNFIQGKTGQE